MERIYSVPQESSTNDDLLRFSFDRATSVGKTTSVSSKVIGKDSRVTNGKVTNNKVVNGREVYEDDSTIEVDNLHQLSHLVRSSCKGIVGNKDKANFLHPISCYPIISPPLSYKSDSSGNTSEVSGQEGEADVFFLPIISEEVANQLSIVSASSYRQDVGIQKVIEEEGLIYICSLTGRLVDPMQPYLCYIREVTGKRYLTFTSVEKNKKI